MFPRNLSNPKVGAKYIDGVDSQVNGRTLARVLSSTLSLIHMQYIDIDTTLT